MPWNSCGSERRIPGPVFVRVRKTQFVMWLKVRGVCWSCKRPGWGKSFVYFIAAKLLREAGLGPAILISPLLALMRNQIAAAERMGVRAKTINSENQEEWQ